MRGWLPHPITAGGLLVIWLLLNQSVAIGHILLGAVIAVAASHAMALLRPEPVRIGSVGAILRLAAVVLADLVRSNLAVAGIVLFNKKYVSSFVQLPLELRSNHGLAVLACIITATPGTVWVQFDRADGILLVHVLDLVDEDQWIQLIKQRYESLLMEIFP